MAQEFTIKSQAIEDKINQLLPSQGGFEPGVDFSASTMVIPIVDLTESAEGSGLRQDLQTALSHGSSTVFSVTNATSTVVNTPGYWRIVGGMSLFAGGSITGCRVRINDGTTNKDVFILDTPATGATTAFGTQTIDLIVKLEAGDSLQVKADIDCVFKGSVRQLADVSGNLINP